MDERRDSQPPPESGPLITPTGDLPTAQQAHLDYNRHIVGDEHKARCQRCSDVDRDRCPEGDRLWRIWTQACDAAYQQLRRIR